VRDNGSETDTEDESKRIAKASDGGTR
jgi:hypothetical protein